MLLTGRECTYCDTLPFTDINFYHRNCLYIHLTFWTINIPYFFQSDSNGFDSYLCIWTVSPQKKSHPLLDHCRNCFQPYRGCYITLVFNWTVLLFPWACLLYNWICKAMAFFTQTNLICHPAYTVRKLDRLPTGTSSSERQWIPPYYSSDCLYHHVVDNGFGSNHDRKSLGCIRKYTICRFRQHPCLEYVYFQP